MLFDKDIGDINRMLIFNTDDGTVILANSSHWFGRVTVKICLEMFLKNTLFMAWVIMKFFLAFSEFCCLQIQFVQ